MNKKSGHLGNLSDFLLDICFGSLVMFYRQTDRQTERQADRQRERERQRLKFTPTFPLLFTKKKNQ